MKMEDEQQHRVKLVLVIDDEAPVREAVEDVLMMLGMGVMTAENGRLGIAHYQENMADIDLVLLDLSMPGISGKETLAELRQLNPEVIVILSSGYSSQDYVPEMDARTDFLQKPYDIDELIAKIRKHLP
ncbi:MAG: response regulator [Ardenticatenaceae bacterium]|nr:response regulator [Ardenticatenaceae bacterium]